MPEWGYTMMCEQTGPRELVDDVVAAEAADFDFAAGLQYWSAAPGVVPGVVPPM